jgi:hypothetical protein
MNERTLRKINIIASHHHLIIQLAKNEGQEQLAFVKM